MYGPTKGPGLGWITAALQLAPAVMTAYQSITGGDSGSGACWTRYNNNPFTEPCPNTPDYDAVIRAVKAAPAQDINQLITWLKAGNAGMGPSSRADLARPECVPFWVKAILGGKGCVASTFPNAPAWFLDFVTRWGEPLTMEQTLPGSAIGALSKPTNALPALVAGGLALWFLPRLLDNKGRD